MPRGNATPSMQDIAKASGYGRSTVSLAMRDHPSLPESTRQKIRQVATRLGYQPNPLVKALMTQIRGRRMIRTQKLALVCRFRSSLSGPNHQESYYAQLYQNIRHHAKEHGFGIDEFYIGSEAMPEHRLSDILVNRGIQGVLFFPGRENPSIEYPVLDWRHFATVLIGYNTTRESLHQVNSDYAYDIDLALDRVRRLGLVRVGIAITKARSQSTNHTWLSRYLLDQHARPARTRIAPLLSDTDAYNPKDVIAWYEKHRPEAILIAGDEVSKILVQAGVNIPRDVRLLNLVQRGEAGLAGIDPHTAEVGRAAVNLLASQVESNQRGTPDFPLSIAIKGHWSPGDSFPE